MEIQKKDLSGLKHLLDYSKYLHEQEDRRNDKLTGVTNIYLAAITFAFTVVIGVLGFMYQDFEGWLAGASVVQKNILIGVFSLSILFILISLAFVLLVVKVRYFERLCNPKEFFSQSTGIDEEEVLNQIISHYVVATERNFIVNNRRGVYLSYGLTFYVIGLILMGVETFFSLFFAR